MEQQMQQLMTLEFKQLYREMMIFAGRHSVPWKTRIQYILSNWDTAINKEEFEQRFHVICQEARLPWKTFDLETAFAKAGNEWRDEIMTDIAKNLYQRGNVNMVSPYTWLHLCRQ